VPLASQNPLHVELSFLDHKLRATSKPFKSNMEELHTSPIKSANRLPERCSTQSGQLIGVSRIEAFVVFYKDIDVTRLHTGGKCLQNGVSLVDM
jgi:hypothetical protein